MHQAELEFGQFVDLYGQRNIDGAGIQDSQFRNNPIVASFCDKPNAVPRSIRRS